MDSRTTVEQLKARVALFRDARGWKQFHNPKDLAASISIEANELLELFQWKTPDEVESLLKDARKREEVQDELADIVVYCISAADQMNVDLSDAIESKLRKNESKYPVEKAFGNNKKYTEL
ncbi:nucleotide pyrophosphohydrolase [Candidatus Micrarchaeota archaeon]|nr:nucleotide pyrophosphohydrolase [Candidatus Micrarchaeota archaeon]